MAASTEQFGMVIESGLFEGVKIGPGGDQLNVAVSVKALH